MIYAATYKSVKTAPAICGGLISHIAECFVHEIHDQGRVAA
jgi:hypothetical protein